MEHYLYSSSTSAADWLDNFIPSLAIDCVVFGFHGGNLKVLLLKWKGTDVWCLPGGFVGRRESLDAAADRVLRQRTGLRRVHLRQYHAFGGLKRKEAFLRRLFVLNRAEIPSAHWLFDRVVSIGYYALVDYQKAKPKADPWADSCLWCPLDGHPSLAFDHERMVDRALEALRMALDAPATGAGLLPERFTMPELQQLHEAILGRKLDRRNFQKSMLERGGIERLPERRTGGAHKAPYLYRFLNPAARPDV